MAILKRDGVNLYYEVYGKGPAILLTHGYSATSAMWRPQIKALSKSHTLVLWDMRGHGASDYPEDQALYSEAATVADMGALLDAVGAERAMIGGLSLGGYMTLAFNLAHPQRARALLMIDTGPGFKNDAAREQWNETARATADQLRKKGLAYLQEQSPERAMSIHRSADGLVKSALGMLTQRDARVINSLGEIKVPSLVVVGANDAPFLTASDYMAKKILGARKIVIPDAGHAVNIDQPAAFNSAMLEFIGGVK
jgi:pimeloyl-ACP methyl ester carboxylesterase